jgi:20S proteasome alpha/beta subunit
MRPRFIPDLHDWSGGFFSSAPQGNSGTFSWVWSADADHVLPASSAISPDESLPTPGPVSGDVQTGASNDTMALVNGENHEGDFSYHGSDAAPASPEGVGAPQAGISLATATSVLPLAVAEHPAAGPAAVPVPEVGGSHGGAIPALALADYQMFSVGPPAAEPASGTASAAILANSAGPVEVSSGHITDAGVGSHGATAAQVQQALGESGLSVNGAGIKVGVLSDSFNNLGGASADEADGALPASGVQVLKDLSSGGTDEGRAMSQIVHDIAPGASLAFYTAFDSEQDFANGILALAAAGCKVICDDVSYFDEPFFQNGVIAQAIQTVEAEGVTYVTSAGNNAGNGYQAAWTPISGTFDGRTLTDAESFGGSLVQTVSINTEGTGDDVPLLLEWNQAYGAATSNLEILVFNSSGQLVGTATNASSGEPTNPWVEYDFTRTGTYYVAIENLSGPNPGLIKEITEGNGLPATISGANAGTVFGHAMTPGVITAGAVSVAQTPAFGVNPALSESFSSSGAGTELLFANDGTALSSPDVLNPVVVSGVDDIATTVSGGLSDFYGTSAASASLAGVAALILSANPGLTPAEVEQIMEQSALPMSNTAVSGTGLVQVNQAVAAAVPHLIESLGSTSLLQIGSNYFLDPVAGGTGPELKYSGSPVTVGEFGAWTFIGAEQISGGYEVALHLPGSDQYTVWNTDSSGNVVSNATGGVVSGTSNALESLEASFHQDLNGDGTIGVAAVPGTVIEALGSTSLVQVGSNYFFNPVAGGTGPELKYSGSPVTVGEFGAWTFIGAEQISGGYEVALHLPGNDQYTVWNTDGSGNVVSNATGGVVSGTSNALESLEASFHQDLNGDGTIGVAAVPGTIIEALGSTSLVQVGSNYFLNPVAGGTGPELKYSGSPVTVGEFGAWTFIGAEQTSNGYEVALHLPGNDQYTVWNTDSSGNVVSNATGGVVSGTSNALESLEASFHQDLNGDGTIGVVAVPGTVIEALGSTSLVQVGSNYFLNPVAGGTGPELKYSGAPVTVGEFGAWTFIGGEQTSGGYEVALHLPGSDQYTVWNTDGSGNVISNATGGVVSGTSNALESLETSFHQDLNGDGTIGVVAGSSTTPSPQSLAVGGQAGDDNFVFHSAFATSSSANSGNTETSEHDAFSLPATSQQLAAHFSDAHSGTSFFEWASGSLNAIINSTNHDGSSPSSDHVALLLGHSFIIH